MKRINLHWLFLFGAIYLITLFSNLIFPITYDDDFAYSQAGNPILLQWQEYLSYHGRMVTHTIARIISQWGYPFTDIVASLIALFFFIVSYANINPDFLKSNDKKDFSLFTILFFIFYAFVPMSCTAYGMTIFFMSNFFSIGLILLFLIPYSALIQETPFNPSKWLWLSALLAGASQEQAASILPLLLIIYGILKYKKSIIPSWFWIGFIFYLVGVVFINASPGSPKRIIGYGGALEWEFMGQKLNWIDLGWKRYFYSLYRHLLLDKISAYLPNTVIYYAIICILFRNILKKIPALDARIIYPIIFIIGSWGMFSIMMFSPLYYQANLIFALIFLWIAMLSLFKNYIAISQNYKLLKLVNILTGFAFITIWGIQVFAWDHYRKEYNNVVSKIEKEKQYNSTEIKVPEFTQYALSTPFGNIYPVYLYRSSGFYQRMAQYYNSPPINPVKPETLSN